MDRRSFSILIAKLARREGITAVTNKNGDPRKNDVYIWLPNDAKKKIWNKDDLVINCTNENGNKVIKNILNRINVVYTEDGLDIRILYRDFDKFNLKLSPNGIILQKSYSSYLEQEKVI